MNFVNPQQKKEETKILIAILYFNEDLIR